MANAQSGFVAIFSLSLLLLLLVGIAQSAENLRCGVLEKVFPDCPCHAATEEKGAVYAIVDCSDKSLLEVPTIAQAHSGVIYKLVLKNNRITTLSNNSFSGLQIEYLDLTGNGLTSIESGTFLSMKDSLRTLEIDGDTVVGPPVDALKELANLESLRLGSYNVSVIDRSQNLFLAFTHLKSLTLHQWNTYHIEGMSFVGPNKLQSLTISNFPELENLPLEALASDPFGDLETLHISGTKIADITHSAFKELSKLQTLDLSNNMIIMLEENCFLKVEDTLQSINLHGNLLNKDRTKGLSGMTNLKHLDLSKNTFKEIPYMANLGTTKPLKLLLNLNEIESGRENAFNGYAQYLNSLDLTSNYIRGMNENTFSGVTGLMELYMNDQKGIDSAAIQVPTSLTNSASTLHKINLSGQKVDATSLWATIRGLTSLRNLNLRATELTSIPDLIFQKVTVLEELDLSFNSISEVNQKSFAGLRQLTKVNLESNNIKTIPSCSFYEFQSSTITLTLDNNPIKCDCKIRQLLEDAKSGRITLDPKAKCLGDNQLLVSKDPNNLVCNPPYKEQPCSRYYTTTPMPVTSGPVTVPTPPKLSINILGISFHALNISWIITDHTNVDRYKLEVTSSTGDVVFRNDNIPKSMSRFEATGLPVGTSITACVKVYLINNLPPITTCQTTKTKSNDPDKSNLDGNSDSAETGIIVGCVVAGVAFVGVIAAIIILLIFRKKPKNVPDNQLTTTQPRNFAKAELPSMTGESRTFKKAPKKTQSPELKGMQVVVISDGQTSPGARVGRANMMFQGDDYEPMDNFKKMNGGSMYENDHGDLPQTPDEQDSVRPPSYPSGAYYNQGFSEDKYDEIEVRL